MNKEELIQEALEIAIDNWMYDGEHDKADQAKDLLRGME